MPLTLPVITSQAVVGSSGVTLMARLVGQDGALIDTTDLASVSIVVTDLTQVAAGQSGAVSTYTPDPTTVTFDVLQTGLPWDRDSVVHLGPDGLCGYNFLFLVPASSFAAGGHKYQIDCNLVPFGAEPFVISYSVPTQREYA
jgi:hypothetical protein